MPAHKNTRKQKKTANKNTGTQQHQPTRIASRLWLGIGSLCDVCIANSFSPIGLLFRKLPSPPCAVLLVMMNAASSPSPAVLCQPPHISQLRIPNTGDTADPQGAPQVIQADHNGHLSTSTPALPQTQTSTKSVGTPVNQPPGSSSLTISNQH